MNRESWAPSTRSIRPRLSRAIDWQLAVKDDVVTKMPRAAVVMDERHSNERLDLFGPDLVARCVALALNDGRASFGIAAANLDAIVTCASNDFDPLLAEIAEDRGHRPLEPFR